MDNICSFFLSGRLCGLMFAKRSIRYIFHISFYFSMSRSISSFSFVTKMCLHFQRPPGCSITLCSSISLQSKYFLASFLRHFFLGIYPFRVSVALSSCLNLYHLSRVILPTVWGFNAMDSKLPFIFHAFDDWVSFFHLRGPFLIPRTNGRFCAEFSEIPNFPKRLPCRKIYGCKNNTRKRRKNWENWCYLKKISSHFW